jgi:hypothetical protein
MVCMPWARASSAARSRCLTLAWRSSEARRRSRAVHRGGERAVAAALEGADEAVGEPVGAQRREADAHARGRRGRSTISTMRGWSLTAAPTSPTFFASGGPRRGSLHRREAHPAVGALAHHAVGAAPRAAALGLHQEHVRQLRVGRHDLRVGRELGLVVGAATSAAPRRARAGTHTWGVGERVEPRLGVDRGRAAMSSTWCTTSSASPMTTASAKPRGGVGLEKVSGPPMRTKGCRAGSRSSRSGGTPASSRVSITTAELVLVGHREGDDGVVAQGSHGLVGEHGLAVPRGLLEVVGREGPLGHECRRAR